MLCGLLTAKRKVIGKWDYWLCLLVGSTILALGLRSKGYWMFGKTWAAHPRQNFSEYLWKKAKTKQNNQNKTNKNKPKTW